MTEFLQFTVIGVITGSIYAVAASGLVLTYTTTGVFNFAHGAVGMAAAYAYYWLRVERGLPTLVAVAVVVLVLAPAAGAVTQRVMRRFRGAPPALSLVATIALTLLLIGLAQTAFDARTSRRLPPMFGDGSFHVAGVVVTYDQVAFLVVAIAVAVGLRWLLHRTRIGMTMRATVDNAGLVELCGAGAEGVARVSWALGYLLAAAAGVLLASGQPLVAEVLAFLVINAYAAATFGRMRSLPLTIAGALALGLVQSWTNVSFLFPSGEAWDRVRLAIPGLFLLGSLVALPEARLAAARATGGSVRVPSLRSSLLGAGGLVVAMALVASAAPADRVTDAARGVVIAIPMLSLVLLSGYGGQISLATYTFMGLGAWTLSNVAAGGGSLGIVFAGALAVPLGVLVALPAMRLQGLYLALATFALALAGRELLIRDPHIFGGVPRAIPRPHLFGMNFNGDRAFLVLTTVAFVALALAVVGVRRRAVGRRLYAMRDSEMACATLGMDIRLLKLGLFAASAAIAGIGGAFFGSFNRSVGDTQWEPLFNIVIFLYVFVAGIDSVAGALIGGLLLSLSGLVQSEHPAIAGLVFAGIAAVAIQLGRQPGGLVGLVAGRARAVRPRARRTAVFAGILVLVTTSGGAAYGEEANPFGAYKLSAEAVGVRFSYAADNPLGISPLVEVTVPQSTAALSAGPIGHAISSVVYPGRLPADPQALADSAGIATPTKLPGWPVRAQADTAGPIETKDTTTVPGTVMHASAKDEVVTADTRVPGWSQDVAAFGASRTTASTKRVGDKVISESRAVVQDLDLLGGVIRVASVTTTARAVTDGNKGSVSGGIQLSGVTVAGQAATIDGSGVHFTGSPLAGATRQAQALMSALAAAGISVRVADVLDQRGGPQAQRTAPGLMIESAMKAGDTPMADLLDQIPAGELTVPNSPFQLADAIAFMQGAQLTRVFVGAAQVSVDGRPAFAFDLAAGALPGIAGGFAGSGASAGGTIAGPAGSYAIDPGGAATLGAPAAIGSRPTGAPGSAPLSSTTFVAVIVAFLVAAPLLAAAGRRLAHAIVGDDGPAGGCRAEIAR